ncbi:MAG: hypothetical protein E2O80_02805 [Betaproteobacteria bacterium]|nr:MAG: hypothetical protein E2O80_02805 [Betaproteobacteria bacterium]
MKLEKSRLLSFAWVILVLSLMIFPTTSYASESDGLLKAASIRNLSRVRALQTGIDVDHTYHIGHQY